MSQVKISGNASGTGVLTIAAPNTNTDRTINIPDTAGNIVTTGDSGTITAPMLDGGQSGSAPAFGVRAWMRYDGISNTIIGSGNVSSVTDNGSGDFSINFTTAMPNGNYTIATAMEQFATTSQRSINCGYYPGTGETTLSTSSVRVACKMTENTSVFTDFEGVSVVLVA